MSARWDDRLRLELDREDRTYAAGEPIAGRVWVEGRAQPEIELSLHWRTAGKGNVDQREPLLAAVLTEQKAPEDGAPRALPFSFAAPAGPASYHGKLLQLDWLLCASAGRTKVEQDIVLTSARETWVGGRSRQRGGRRRRRRHPAASAMAGLLLLLCGLLAVATALTWGGDLAPPCLIVGLILAGIGVPTLRNPAAEWRLGAVHLEHDEEVAPGESVRVSITLRPPRPLPVNAISVRLVGEEKVESGSGSSRTTHTHPFLIRSHPLCGRATLREELTLEAELPLPPDVPHSFASAENRLQYRLEVRIDIPGWPDWHADVPVLVLPGTPSAPRVRAKLDLQPRQRCPFCRDQLAGSSDTLHACDGCGTVLHDACWDESERCPTAGCGSEPPRRPRVRARA